MNLEQQISSLSLKIVFYAAILLVVLIIMSIVIRDRKPKLKPYLFGAIALTLALPTLFMTVGTVYLNMKSESGGPVHWHAEIEFWACGTELELRDPSAFLSNKIGTSTYHEHDDKHIHMEGVVVDKKEDASLGKFMEVVGGSMTNNSVAVPLNPDQNTWKSKPDHRDGDNIDSSYELTNEDIEQFVKYTDEGPVANLVPGVKCDDQTAELRVTAYKFNERDNTYSQVALQDPADYTMTEDPSLGPPADCVIVEFDSAAELGDKSNKLCPQYGIKDEVRCQSFGVKDPTPELCNIRQIDNEESV